MFVKSARILLLITDINIFLIRKLKTHVSIFRQMIETAVFKLDFSEQVLLLACKL